MRRSGIGAGSGDDGDFARDGGEVPEAAIQRRRSVPSRTTCKTIARFSLLRPPAVRILILGRGFSRAMNFAALTLDNHGLKRYGNYFVILKDQEMATRASVFEENPFDFRLNHNVIESVFGQQPEARPNLGMWKSLEKALAKSRAKLVPI
jgi:hypothetical protein